jgi:hypothetical protein
MTLLRFGFGKATVDLKNQQDSLPVIPVKTGIHAFLGLLFTYDAPTAPPVNSLSIDTEADIFGVG